MIPMNATTKPPRWKRFRTLIVAGLAVAALVVGVNIAAAPEFSDAEPASAHAMTYVHNTGSTAFTVVRDNGARTAVYPGQGVWGVTYVLLSANQCVTGTISRCVGYQGGTVFLGIGQYNLRRV